MPTAKRTRLAKLAVSGKSAIIGLSVIKHLLRQRWSTLGPATNATMEGLLRQKLGPSDHFVQIDDATWLVVMPEATKEELQGCCLRMAYELHVKVRPPCELAQLRIADTVVVADDLLELNYLHEEKLRDIARSAGLVQELLVPKPLNGTVKAEPAAFSGTVRYQPVWDATRQAITSYLCMSPVAGSGSHLQVGELLKCAQFTLGQAVHALETTLYQGSRCAVVVPLPYDMLSAPTTRMDFLGSCRQLACELRPYLIYEIAHLPRGVPKSRLIEIVSAIQPFGRAVTARPEPNTPSLMDYGGTGLKALSLDVPFIQARSAMNEISRLTAATKRLGIAACVGNVASQDVLEHAFRSGVHWISGPHIGAPVDELGPPVRLNLVRQAQTSAPRLATA